MWIDMSVAIFPLSLNHINYIDLKQFVYIMHIYLSQYMYPVMWSIQYQHIHILHTMVRYGCLVVEAPTSQSKFESLCAVIERCKQCFRVYGYRSGSLFTCHPADPRSKSRRLVYDRV